MCGLLFTLSYFNNLHPIEYEKMKISDTQLSEYMALYETSYGVRLERTKALAQLNKLLSLVLYIIFPESTVGTLEKELAEEYTNRGIQKV